LTVPVGKADADAEVAGELDVDVEANSMSC
jgi:hypothetical protein